MEIEVAFNLDDVIWYMNNNQIKNSTITGFEVTVNEDKTVSIIYLDDYGTINSTQTFNSKERLIKYLRNEATK